MSFSRRALQSDRKLHCDGTVDIECSDWDRFNVAATHTNGVTHHWRSPEECLRFIAGLGGTWWAHAGGVYDFCLFAEVLRRLKIHAVPGVVGGRIVSLTAAGFTLRDSWALIPMPLSEAVEMIGERTHKFPWRCQCGSKCGGYCRIGSDPDPDVDEHCACDAEQLSRVLWRLAEFADAFGFRLRSTIGATAWATAEARLALPKATLPPEIWRRLAPCVKGGRILIGAHKRKGPGAHWDIRSAHAASLAKTALPVGHMAELGARQALDAIERRTPGIYHVRMTIPDCDFPPLPWRHGGKIVYPTGTFSGHWCLPELEAAIERGGEIDRVYSAIAWSDERVIFDGLMREWFAIRGSLGRDTALGKWTSNAMQALTGKFAESPEKEIIYIHPEKWRYCMRRGACAERCTERCGAFTQLDRWGEIASAPIWRMAPSGHLAWHCYLTAQTRIAQLQGFETVGLEHVVYGHQDSVWCTGNRAPGVVGPGLGDWQYKHAWRDWTCVAPNHYAFTRDGDPEVRAAGVSRLTRAEWDRGYAERDRGVVPFRQAARESRGLFRRRREQWTMPRIDDSGETWLGDRRLDSARQITYPGTAREHRIRSQRQQQRRARVSNSQAREDAPHA